MTSEQTRKRKKTPFQYACDLLFSPRIDLETEEGLRLLDKLYFENKLTHEDLEKVSEGIKKHGVGFLSIFRRLLDAPPTPDRFWWFDRSLGETPEEQIADDLKDPEAYLEYRKRLAGK